MASDSEGCRTRHSGTCLCCRRDLPLDRAQVRTGRAATVVGSVPGQRIRTEWKDFRLPVPAGAPRVGRRSGLAPFTGLRLRLLVLSHLFPTSPVCCESSLHRSRMNPAFASAVHRRAHPHSCGSSRFLVLSYCFGGEIRLARRTAVRKIAPAECRRPSGPAPSGRRAAVRTSGAPGPKGHPEPPASVPGSARRAAAGTGEALNGTR